MPPLMGKMGDVTMTTAQFKDRLEALDNTDLEGYSDVLEDFGAELLAYCDRPEVADETVSTTVDLDAMCCNALDAIMCGDSLETARAYITDEHRAAPGARAILSDLHMQWQVPA